MTDSKNHTVLQQLVDNLTKVIDLGEQTKLNQRKLRWEFTRQLHLALPEFWLEGKSTPQLISLHDDYYDEYEEVMGLFRPQSSGSMVEDVKAWSMWQKRRWEEAQN